MLKHEGIPVKLMAGIPFCREIIHQEIKVKKTIILTLLLITALAANGCGNKKNVTDMKDKETTVSAVQQETTQLSTQKTKQSDTQEITPELTMNSETQQEETTEEEKQTAKDWQQVEEIIRGNPYREAVKQEMYKMSRDEKERYLYLREEMAVSDEVSRMRTAIKEGIKEGEKRGIKLTKKVFQLSQKGCTIAQIAEKCNIEESEVKEILE